ncbi:hypothetical protein BH11PLA2_BH11PLA2_23260 [soil metagenome]
MALKSPRRRSAPSSTTPKASPGARPPAKPYRIENAACPRAICDGDVFHDPDTNRVYCPACEARRAVAALVPVVAAEGSL